MLSAGLSMTLAWPVGAVAYPLHVIFPFSEHVYLLQSEKSSLDFGLTCWKQPIGSALASYSPKVAYQQRLGIYVSPRSGETTTSTSLTREC